MSIGVLDAPLLVVLRGEGYGWGWSARARMSGPLVESAEGFEARLVRVGYAPGAGPSATTDGALGRPRTVELCFEGACWSIVGYLDLEDESGDTIDVRVGAKHVSEARTASDPQPTLYRCAATGDWPLSTPDGWWCSAGYCHAWSGCPGGGGTR